jgi:hypothetical protein
MVLLKERGYHLSYWVLIDESAIFVRYLFHFCHSFPSFLFLAYYGSSFFLSLLSDSGDTSCTKLLFHRTIAGLSQYDVLAGRVY